MDKRSERKGFVNKVEETIAEFGMLNGADTVIAALSGGADSVSLLRALCELRERCRITVRACHLNHGLRGAQSDGDEEFCKRLCEALGVPIVTAKVNVAEHRNKHESIEEAARRIRYGFFDKCLEKSGGNSVIAAAHTANDNAETVLLNITRGTGLKGLCGIPPVRGRIVRPLIRRTRDEVEEYLKSIGQGYVTDNTNFSEEYSRNKIRLSVIPRLLEINPALLEVICRMTDNLRVDSEYLEKLANNALLAADTERRDRAGRGYDAACLYGLPAPVRSRAVKKILSDGGIEPSGLRINTAVSLLSKRSARFNPCKNRFFTIRKGVCFVEKTEQKYRRSGENFRK